MGSLGGGGDERGVDRRALHQGKNEVGETDGQLSSATEGGDRGMAIVGAINGKRQPCLDPSTLHRW